MANLVQDLKRSIQEQFQREIGYRTDFCQLFNELERVAFFLKNRRFQIVFANRVFFERLGFSEEEQIVGKDDFELFPRPLATKFRRDDESVMRTGISSPRMVELFLTRHGLPEWYVTNKRPVLNQKGQPAGVMGTVQRYDQGRALRSSHPGVMKAVQMMLSDPGNFPSIGSLAASLEMSIRNFDRRFKEDTGFTPKQFLGRARVRRACQLLQESDASISELALELGFCDQSAFTAQFRIRMGMTPLKYRKQFGHFSLGGPI